MNDQDKTFVPALGYRALTPVYDLAVRLVTREQTFKRALIAQANLRMRHRILDLGCGTGTLAILIKQMHPGLDVRGLDADPDVLSLARGKAHLEDLEIPFDEGMATELPYENGYFDRVMSTLFFHHLPARDKQRTLAEVRRVLKPRGELHVADWGPPQNLLMRLAFLPIQALDGFDNTDDSVDGKLLRMMRDAGFRESTEKRCLATPMGTISLYRSVNPA